MKLSELSLMSQLDFVYMTYHKSTILFYSISVIR